MKALTKPMPITMPQKLLKDKKLHVWWLWVWPASSWPRSSNNQCTHHSILWFASSLIPSVCLWLNRPWYSLRRRSLEPSSSQSTLLPSCPSLRGTNSSSKSTMMKRNLLRSEIWQASSVDSCREMNSSCATDHLRSPLPVWFLPSTWVSLCLQNKLVWRLRSVHLMKKVSTLNKLSMSKLAELKSRRGKLNKFHSKCGIVTWNRCLKCLDSETWNQFTSICSSTCLRVKPLSERSSKPTHRCNHPISRFPRPQSERDWI